MNTRTRICITTPEFPPDQWGGLARTAERVARCAEQSGLEVHVAVFQVAEGPVVLLDENRVDSEREGLAIHRITLGRERIPEARELWDCPHNLTLQMMYQSLEMLHRDVGFALFHSFFLYPVGYVTGLLAKRFRGRSVATIVGNDVKKYPFSPEKAALCRSGLENADLVVALSGELLDMADALYPIRDKARVVYNSVEIPRESWSSNAVTTRHQSTLQTSQEPPAWSEPTNITGLSEGGPGGTSVHKDASPGRLSCEPFRIGCAGIFKYAKGLPYLFKAVARLSERFPLVLEMRGTLRDSEKDVYEEMLSRTGIARTLRLLEPLSHDRIPGWLRSLDLFVLPSVSEGCPNILMEAMASGVPCVATGTGAVEDLMQDRVSGLVVPWGNSAALAEAIERLLLDPELAASLGTAGWQRMRLFSPQKEQSAWKSVYAQLEALLHDR